jgi:WYL_2, Sm-like SH3 beta-barrel fold
MRYIDMSEADQEAARDWLHGLLQDSIATVTFLKSDGSTRVLKCTRNPTIVPKYENKTDRKREPNDDVCSVWDVEIDEWRSFRYDSIQSIEFTIGDEAEPVYD